MKLRFWFDKNSYLEDSNIPREEIFKLIGISPNRTIQCKNYIINMQNLRYIEILEE